MEFRQGDKDPSKAAATLTRPKERGDLGHRIQWTIGAEQELVNEESLCKTFTTYIIKWLTLFISLDPTNNKFEEETNNCGGGVSKRQLLELPIFYVKFGHKH